MNTYYENTLKEIYLTHRKHSYSFASHFHAKIEVAYCFSGMQKIKIGETTYTMHSGDAAFVFPNTVHEYIKCSTAPDVETESISLISDTDFFASLMPDIITKKPLSPFVAAKLISSDTAYAFRKMTTASDSMELLGWGCIALSGIINRMELAPLKLYDSEKLAPALIAYINSNFQKPLTIKSIATEFGYSSSYVAHIFYEQLKIPFRTLLGSVRSEHAKELIIKTDKSLTEISYECGYNCVNTFCRCFKKHTGKTPSEFKKETKKDVIF